MENFSIKTVSTALNILKENYTKDKLNQRAIELGIQNPDLMYSKRDVIVSILQQISKKDENTNDVLASLEQQSLNRQENQRNKKEIVEDAIECINNGTSEKLILKLKNSLYYDGFSLTVEEVEDDHGNLHKNYSLRRTLPNINGIDFNKINDELTDLLKKHNMQIQLGHLNQAIENFDACNWAASNAQIRTFFESSLSHISVALGCDISETDYNKRNYLGRLENPFLLDSLNEWKASSHKPQFVQGLMARLHPEGSHSGLSNEDDCFFRLQITMIAARLFLKRFDKRV